MTIQHSPAPARSDVATPAPTGSSPRHPYAVHGRVLTAGAVAWSATMAVVGIDPGVRSTSSRTRFAPASSRSVCSSCSARCGAPGPSARVVSPAFVLRFEAVAVAAGHRVDGRRRPRSDRLDQPGWIVLDAFWPLSMLGMFLIGIRIAIAGRWKGLSRFWPMVAESWAVVTIPALGIFGEAVGQRSAACTWSSATPCSAC